MPRFVDHLGKGGARHYFRYILPLILNRETQEQLLDLMAEISKVPAETKPAARSMFLNTLRGLVNQWICSGKSSDGIEEAWKRSVRWKTLAYPRPIAETLLGYWDRNFPHAKIGDDDRIEIEIIPALPMNPLLRAREMGIYHFLVLLDSSMREELSQCDKCGTYFVRKRMPRKDEVIKRGSYCANCKSSASVVRTKASREKEREALLVLAVKLWPKWTPRKHPNRALWVAQQMNDERKGPERRITQKWVSRNIDCRSGKVKKTEQGK